MRIFCGLPFHKNEALSVRQREQMQLPVAAKTSSYQQLAQRYRVSLPTLQRGPRRADGQGRR